LKLRFLHLRTSIQKCLWVWIILLLSASPSASSETDFAIHFLDVGQGDAAIILCDDEVLMIDGGSPGNSSFIYSYLKNTLGLDHIDHMVASHPHEDHVGGLSGALNACTVGNVYSPVEDYPSDAFQAFLKYSSIQGLNLIIPQSGDTFQLGSATVQFLSPAMQYFSINDMSLVIRIVYGQTSFLFMGDAEWDAEHQLVDSCFDLSSTVLKVGHHSSETSSSYVFLREVMPEYAIISVGDGNHYGHPSDDVLSRLHDADTNVYRTDQVGTVILTSDGVNLSFETEC